MTRSPSPTVVGLLLLTLVVSGCASFKPPPGGDFPFMDRAETRTAGELVISAAALTAEESLEVFGKPLAKEGVQPVWLRVENRSANDYSLMTISLDPDYFSALEVAWQFRAGLSQQGLQDLNVFFYRKSMPQIIRKGETAEGFVFTNPDEGLKVVNVELVSDHGHEQAEFLLWVPGLKADFLEVDFDSLYAGQEVADLDLEALRDALAELPCCALGGDRKTPGDPLNIAVIGPS